ncbi:MAG: hypothetical protein IPL61_18020 [Myxococcales bacterium]|nr:hypothetical protein [Myxococcales bacterium]
MRNRMTTFGVMVLAAVIAAGCAKSPASPSTAAPANAGGGAATSSDVPDEPKVVCHLDCSGTEATGYGATEEEARADVARHVEQNCKPEDGQYFIFCDPPQ